MTIFSNTSNQSDRILDINTYFNINRETKPISVGFIASNKKVEQFKRDYVL